MWMTKVNLYYLFQTSCLNMWLIFFCRFHFIFFIVIFGVSKNKAHFSVIMCTWQCFIVKNRILKGPADLGVWERTCILLVRGRREILSQLTCAWDKDKREFVVKINLANFWRTVEVVLRWLGGILPKYVFLVSNTAASTKNTTVCSSNRKPKVNLSWLTKIVYVCGLQPDFTSVHLEACMTRLFN